MYVSTGELSKKLKVSVRTIRYYDQIGLVQPSMLGEGGKRFYSIEDSLKLEKIILLKSLSLTLEEIKKIIEEQSTEMILLAHKAHLVEQSETINQSIAHTNSLLNILKLEGTINWGDLLTLIVPEDKPRNWGMFFTEHEKEILQESLPKIEEDTLATRKWMNLIKRIELCIQEEISPKSAQAKLIMDDMDILSEETFGGNEELISKFWDVRRSQDSSHSLNLYPIKHEIIEFIEQALE
ncbi:MerR family transcriptional regulator [Ferdinandcohnia quinoae]|uniref:MerR family transcriptional regulator n=1 Tax=Fredinandcohnia quinoae TaxID=2918902 RepID=A0AAW5E5L3_9BACI|nr:MerR family transcriptional regulator [Fredinandcohnia sp. SECRCQ15]MCH1627788.1 MerR family transcriptional regulator [Fredinandcohnia sp. SECRCQ15]